MFGHETVEISFCRYKNGKHGNRGKRKHGNGKGSDLFDEHGPQCKRGVNHLPPHLREEKMKENKIY